MRKQLVLVALTLAVALGLGAAGFAQQAARHFDGKSWWEHVKVLADDNMEGRETGSEGLKRSQAYVVDQLTKAGLQPAGVSGFYQPVQLISRQIVEKDSAASLVSNGKEQPLEIGEDAYFGTRAPSTEQDIVASLAFVGYGLKIDDLKYDDLAGLDLNGKVVVYLAGSPQQVPTSLAAHAQTVAERWRALKAAGVIGIITLPNPASMDIPWSRMTLSRTHPSMILADPEFDDAAGLKISLTFNPAHAEKLFAGSGHTFSEVAALAKDRKALPTFPLAVSLKAHAVIHTAPVESANIIAKLPGNDPVLKDEYVVLSAHVDHIGIGEPINGDRIYNGAMDNASGTAALLDIAASWKAHSEQLRRSVLFVLVTAEEKGLLGSRYFAAHPTVPLHSMVADLNLDMFLPIIPLKVLTVPSLDESDLGDRIRQAAQTFGVSVQPDPEPLRNVFIRSDQYSFVRRGIPSLKIDVGFEAGSPEQKVMKEWLTTRYHAPSDDLTQPVNLESAGLFEEVVRQLLISVANTDARPQWKPNSFFRRYATPD
jgi:Zn-dependent M28 family amino/carboxypeptidase